MVIKKNKFKTKTDKLIIKNIAFKELNLLIIKYLFLCSNANQALIRDINILLDSVTKFMTKKD